MTNLNEINGTLGFSFVMLTLLSSLVLCIISLIEGRFKWLTYLLWSIVFIFILFFINQVSGINSETFKQREIVVLLLIIIGFGTDIYFSYDLAN